MRRLTTAIALFAATPAGAAESIKYPITIPQECFALAQREGVSTVIESRYQAVKARLKLARMSDRDPLVHECRAAVNRARQAYEAASRQQPATNAMKADVAKAPEMERNSAVRTTEP